MSHEKLHCGGRWTLARKRSFITSALRRASGRWAPKYECKKRARVGRNQYVCASCGKTVGNKSIRVDHITPVVDPVHGFVGWDQFIDRLFVEIDGYQAICLACHEDKTTKEREVRKLNRKK
jgi:5-methylcytosine-specific restriction endonuclease McrA